MGWPIGKRYEGGHCTVERGAFEAYAKATDDPNPRHAGDASVAPPMFHVRPFIDLMLALAADPELEIDMLRLVHGEHAMSFRRLLRDGDDLTLWATLDAVDDKSSGRVFTFGLFADAGGERVLEGHTSYFIRGEAPKGPKKAKAPAPEPPPASWTVEQPVTADQATRYAAASGDGNPIHTDPEVAQRAGLPGVILHGLCTLAFAGRDIVARTCDGDPGRLASLGVRFARPVFPGESLSMDAWEDGSTVHFVTRNAKGQPVLVAGKAEVR